MLGPLLKQNFLTDQIGNGSSRDRELCVTNIL